jgi:signal transduction histidine kinase
MGANAQDPPARSRRIGFRVRTVLGGIRLRLVWWYIVILALATVGSVLLVRQVLVQRLDARIDADLVQETAELRQLAEGNDPETGEPFGTRVGRIFEVFLDRNIPARHEAFLAYLDGRLAGTSPAEDPPIVGSALPYAVHADAALAAIWSDVADTRRGRAETPAGRVEYLAVPFLVDGQPEGVFVVVSFRDVQQADTDAATFAAAALGLVMLVVGSLLAMRLAERILAPVRLVTQTARAISETDLSRRIPDQGHDEISALATTFNDMLARLEAAFGMQRRFLDDAGHELRTPITVIRGHLEVMGDDPDDRRRTLELVSDELERMSRMVDELLTLARIERPDFLRRRTVDVDELTVRTFETAKALGPRDWKLDGVSVGRAWLDDQRIVQAVLQLAANAVRHTTEGQVVALGSRHEGEVLRFWVRDTGPGVDPDEREKIFERFYRGRSGSSRSDGAGLGLSIVQAIANAHGGRVDVDGVVGGGATFSISVPVGAEDMP